MEKIIQYIELYKDVPGLEIEFRLGYIENNSFNANISKEFYDKIHNELLNSSAFKKVNSVSIDTFYDTPVRVRHSSSDNSYIKKTRLCNLDLSHEPFDIRVSFSKEEIVKTKPNSKCVFIRNKERDSFLYKYWSYDITKVTQTENSLDIVNHEIELEIKKDLGKKTISNEFMRYLVESSLMKINDLSQICEPGSPDDFKIIKETVY